MASSAIGQKFRGYGKNERRILRTGTKPIRCKIDFFIFESDQRPATNVEFTAERFGPIHDDANSEPACGGATDIAASAAFLFLNSSFILRRRTDSPWRTPPFLPSTFSLFLLFSAF